MNWVEDKHWLEMVEKNLYPPKKFVFEKTINKLLKEYDFRNKRVLDYGCGTGKVGLLAKKAGANVVGVDVSENLLPVASERIKVEHLLKPETNFEAAYFDYVFCFMVLHVVSNPIPIIRELSRVMKPSGKLFFSIVHPFSVLWDETGAYSFDQSYYYHEQKRKWFFHLKNGKNFQANYYHRPLSSYYSALSPYFMINRIDEPTLPGRFLRSKKYAPVEFLFGVARKIAPEINHEKRASKRVFE